MFLHHQLGVSRGDGDTRLVFICLEAPASLIGAAGEVLRLGAQPLEMPCGADQRWLVSVGT